MSTTAAEHKHAALIDSQRRVLERIATGAPLEDVLALLIRLIEEQAGDMRCAILLADDAQTRLRFVAAPHVPADYRRGIEPYLLIAPDMGSCGTAAYLKQPVYTRDTTTDPLWENCGGIAVRNGLRAIWSTPILADDNRVLGTFAMYYGEPRLPSQQHIELIDMSVQMARIAIEAKADDELSILFDYSPSAIAITDLQGNIVRASHAFSRVLGWPLAQLRGKALAEIGDGPDHGVLANPAGAAEVTQYRRYRTRDGRMIRVRERSSVRRDAHGEPRYVVIYVDALADAADAPLERLSQRERQVLEWVLAGKASKEIAAHLKISAASVDTYRSRIMQKLGVEDLPALVRFAIRHGIATP
jgi:PAS domain S-box-containing protein